MLENFWLQLGLLIGKNNLITCTNIHEDRITLVSNHKNCLQEIEKFVLTQGNYQYSSTWLDSTVHSLYRMSIYKTVEMIIEE